MSNQAASPGFFHIYKPGQGKWVRWGTVAALALIAFTGAVWLVQYQGNIALLPTLWKVLIGVVWILGWALGTFWFVNSVKWAEFMIMTESEMRKVTWPSRREVINSVKIVILLTTMLGFLLWIVDLGFIKIFQWAGIS
jgi:preprotein translocase subunit SecE